MKQAKIIDSIFLSLCFIFGILFSLLSILRYNHFMAGFDLAIYDQTIWLYSKFHIPISTVRGSMNILGDHFSPILILLSPLFWIFKDARAILVFQSMITCLSAFLIYKISLKWLKNYLAAFLISLTFFLFLGFQYALDYDFHLVSLSVFPLSLIFFGLFFNRNRLYWLGVTIAFLLKEDLSVVIFFIGLYEIFILKRRKFGLITVFLSSFWFVLETRVIMPFFQAGNPIAKEYIDFYGLGGNLGEMLVNIVKKPWLVIYELLNSPLKIKTFFLTLGSFGFIPIFSPLFLITSTPIWLERFLSQTVARWQFEQYYGISLTPILVLATSQSIILLFNFFSNKFPKIKTHRNTFILTFSFFILVSATLTDILKHAPLTRLIHPNYYYQTASEKSMATVIKLIPPQSSVSVQQPFLAHLSHREKIYLFPEKSSAVEYIALVKGRPVPLLSESELEKAISQLLNDKSYEILYKQNDVYLFKRKSGQ